MTRDPAEGVDAEGMIVTGARAERIPEIYLPVLQDCVDSLSHAFGDQLHSLYLYGSVATGEARPPTSDVDMLAIWTSSVDADRVTRAGLALSERHAHLAREVGVTAAALGDVLSDSRDGHGWRCLIRHYCVHVAGHDLRPSLPRCRPSRATAEALNDDVPALVGGWRAELARAGTPEAVAAVARAAARKLLLVAATLESVEHGGWTTDRGAAARLLTVHHAEWAGTAELALAWSVNPDVPTVQEVRRLLDLGDWLAARP